MIINTHREGSVRLLGILFYVKKWVQSLSQRNVLWGWCLGSSRSCGSTQGRAFRCLPSASSWARAGKAALLWNPLLDLYLLSTLHRQTTGDQVCQQDLKTLHSWLCEKHFASWHINIWFEEITLNYRGQTFCHSAVKLQIWSADIQIKKYAFFWAQKQRHCIDTEPKPQFP